MVWGLVLTGLGVGSWRVWCVVIALRLGLLYMDLLCCLVSVSFEFVELMT